MARAAGARKRQRGTQGREKMRTDLRQMVESTYDTARAISLERPDVKGLFAPASRGNNDQTLVAAARSAADAATPLAGPFTEFGPPPSFFSDTRSKADSLETYASLQASGVGEGVDKNAALEDAFRPTDELIGLLDPVAADKYRGDPAKLAAWKSARRVGHAPRPRPEDDDSAPRPRTAKPRDRATHGPVWHLKQASRAGVCGRRAGLLCRGR